MKKIIALVLTIAMVISMVCCFAGAEFSDADQIDFVNREAVTVLSNLNIIAGMEDGTFAPNNSLTRAQAAKIICCMLLGVEAANALTSDKSSFGDVPTSHWSSKFVEYCATNGIVSGTGAGKFNPNGKLTGFAFGKMLLVAAVGVNAEAEGLTGSKWETNTANLLKENGLNKGVTINNKEMRRQDACLLALNCLFFGEAEDPEATLAYKSFGVTRTGGKVNKKNMWRPTTVYTSETEGLYWDDTDLTVDASPYLIFDGAKTGAQMYDLMGKIEIPATSMYIVRNGVSYAPTADDIAKPKYMISKENSENFASTPTGGTTEVYYDATTDKYSFVMWALRCGEITDVTEASITSDGTVLEEGSVTLLNQNGEPLTFPCNTLSKSDIGKYAMYNGYGKSSWTYLTEGFDAFPAPVVTGTLDAYNSTKDVTIGGKKYTYPRFFTINAKQYVEEKGGAIGDTVNAVVYNGMVYAIYQ